MASVTHTANCKHLLDFSHQEACLFCHLLLVRHQHSLSISQGLGVKPFRVDRELSFYSSLSPLLGEGAFGPTFNLRLPLQHFILGYPFLCIHVIFFFFWRSICTDQFFSALIILNKGSQAQSFWSQDHFILLKVIVGLLEDLVFMWNVSTDLDLVREMRKFLMRKEKTNKKH